jgi:hypothetical protein
MGLICSSGIVSDIAGGHGPQKLQRQGGMRGSGVGQLRQFWA